MSAPSADATSLAAAQANLQAAAVATVAQLNANLTAQYQSACNDATTSINAGQTQNIYWPPVPIGYVVLPPDANGFQFAGIGTQPVCPAIPRPAGPPGATPQIANTIDVGRSLGGAWFSCGPANTVAPGFITPAGWVAEDGTVGTFELFAAPVGKGWWMKVA